MSLVKSKGNMYDWVTHMHTHLGGECQHKCSYCYVQRGMANMSGKYKGEVRFLPKELKVNYGCGKTIFIEHMNDMFSDGVKNCDIEDILNHCRRFPGNAYVFQTKNPERAYYFRNLFPANSTIGTTIESNREYPAISKAPHPLKRMSGIIDFRKNGFPVFVTIEPILDFDVTPLIRVIVGIKPKFVNIGADSKKSDLPEPSRDKVLKLIDGLRAHEITIKKKVNISRILELP